MNTMRNDMRIRQAALLAIFTASCTGTDGSSESGLPTLNEITEPGATYLDLEYSPDGSRITYLKLEGSAFSIWVADANGDNARRVSTPAPSTSDPEWSPDGTWITFTSDLIGVPDVFIVNADGTGERALMETTFQEFYPRPSPDGTRVLYVQIGTGDLWTVPVEGGEPTLLTSASTGVGGWSPDGRFVAFNRAVDGRRTVWVHSVEDGTDRPLTTEGYETFGGNAWSPDSREVLLYSFRTGLQDLWAYPVDGGEPRQLTNDIRTDNLGAFSPDGRWVLFHSERGGQDDVWIAPARGGDAIRVTNDAAEEFDLRWRPDGRAVTFARDDNVSTVHVFDIATGETRQIPSGRSDATQIDVSPDGAWIVFDSEPGGADDIFIVSTEGGEPRLLVGGAANDFTPRFSPDGRQVAFLSSRTGENRLYLIPTEGGEVVPLTSVPTRWPTWSPRGDRIAFVSGSGLEAQVWTVPVAGGEATRITDRGRVASAPTWSPDGSRLIVVAGDDNGGIAMFSVPAEGGAETKLSPDGLVATFGLAWSPDGSMIAFLGGNQGNFDIYVANADGSDVRQLTDTDVREDLPRWSEDGSEIYFLTSRLSGEQGASEFDIAAVPVGGGEVRILLDTPEDELWMTHPLNGRIFFEQTPVGNAFVTAEVGALLDAASGASDEGDAGPGVAGGGGE